MAGELRVGILALQGDFAEHKSLLERCGAEVVLVNLPDQLDGLRGLIIPGGESTTIGKLMLEYRLVEPIRERAGEGFPVLGTCAGAILLAEKAVGLDVEPLGVLGISIRRNAYGRQRESFEAELDIPTLGEKVFPGVFIRAPIIEKLGSGVEVMCRFNGSVVGVRQGNIIGLSFHPELTGDTRLHEYFLNLVSGYVVAKNN